MSELNDRSFAEELVPRWKLDVLSLLMEKEEYQFTIREISQRTSGSYGSVREFIHSLNSWKVVKLTKKGGSLLVKYRKNNKHHKLIQALLETESEKLRKEAKSFSEKITEDFPEVESVIIYGSVARGEAGKNSDIDLLILVKEIEVEEKIREKAQEHSDISTISPIVETVEEFEENLRKEKTFEKEVLKHGKPIKGEGKYERLQEKYRRG